MSLKYYVESTNKPIYIMEIIKFTSHSRTVLDIAKKYGWSPGARYTNIRDVRHTAFARKGFIDIDWKHYDFIKHLDCVSEKRPLLTIARDVESIFQLDVILKEAEALLEYSQKVAIVPKDKRLDFRLSELVPDTFILAYSVPTTYGGTEVDIHSFDRPVHLLGGRPDVQRKIADKLQVISLDCNRFTFDARFGDFFDGETFRPHPVGGYAKCLEESIANINKLWIGYEPREDIGKCASGPVNIPHLVPLKSRDFRVVQSKVFRWRQVAERLVGTHLVVLF